MTAILRALIFLGLVAGGLFGGGLAGRLLGLLATGGDTGLHGGGIVVGVFMIAGAAAGLASGILGGFIYILRMARKDRNKHR